MSELTASQRLDIIRHKGRPTVNDYIPLIFDRFMEMHGDRLFGDDGAIMGGIAYFKGTPVTVIAQVKGRDLAENQKCNFGMPHPEGYRKALRLAKQAEKFHRPVICLVDTAGAFCGVDAEKRGQGEAIAKNLMEFMTLKTPIISIVLGEGGSGGALALGVCDELAMLENVTAKDLTKLGVCDAIIPEAPGGAHNDPQATANNISAYISKVLERKLKKGLDELINERYNKFRIVGEFDEPSLSDK